MLGLGCRNGTKILAVWYTDLNKSSKSQQKEGSLSDTTGSKSDTDKTVYLQVPYWVSILTIICSCIFIVGFNISRTEGSPLL